MGCFLVTTFFFLTENPPVESVPPEYSEASSDEGTQLLTMICLTTATAIAGKIIASY
jgi:hypothetical protein